MSDQDLPLFNFFNVIDVPTMAFEESRNYLVSRSEKGKNLQRIDAIFESVNSSWMHHLTDGRILYLNYLADALSNAENQHLKPTSAPHEVADILQCYFDWIESAVMGDLHRLSYYEKKLIDDATYLPEKFKPSDLQWEERRASFTTKTLAAKGILKRHGAGRSGEYSFVSTAMKSYLRFRKRLPIQEVIAPFGKSTSVFWA